VAGAVICLEHSFPYFSECTYRPWQNPTRTYLNYEKLGVRGSLGYGFHSWR
jgi:hypothetical protein